MISPRKSGLKNTGCLVLVLLLTTVPAMAQGHTPQASFDDSRLSIRVNQQGETLQLEVESTSAGVHSVTLPYEITTVDSISRAQSDELVLVGEVGSTAKEVVILDQGGTTVVDRFVGYQPTLSPNGRYILFTRFFPEHFISESQASNAAMLYDLKDTPSANRPDRSSLDDTQDVGRQVYPVGGGNGSIHSFMSDKFYWSPNSSRVLILDEQNYIATTSPATAHRNLNLKPRPTLELVQINVPSLRVSKAMIDRGACASSGGSCFVKLTSAQFAVDGTITLSLHGFGLHAAYRQLKKVGTANFQSEQGSHL